MKVPRGNAPGPDLALSGVVTLLTDFGEKDGYASAMKGVILSHAPGARLVDITHEIPSFDLKAAALVLDSVFSHFPEGTIHVMVVDPGVGSGRRHLLVQATGHIFIGPDNGVLGRIAHVHQGQSYEIDPSGLGTAEISSTFHGRDVYSLAAARLLAGAPSISFTSPINDPVILELPRPQSTARGFSGELIHVDGFGNCITNLRAEHAKPGSRLKVKNKIIPIKKSYYQLDEGLPGAILNSWGYFEIALKEEQASRRLGLGMGDKVELLTKERN